MYRDLFQDEQDNPLKFFLPLSLSMRSTWKEAIEKHGGILVSSELVPGCIKIGDPLKAREFDDTFTSFKFIDESIKAGVIADLEKHAMNKILAVTGQKRKSSALSGPRGIRRGTRTEFTIEDDEILRRIVHRPGIAVSGNKIYKLIEQEYGRHSFHSWRDRYLKYLEPRWPRPEDSVMTSLEANEKTLVAEAVGRSRGNVSAPIPSVPRRDGRPHVVKTKFTADEDALLRKYMSRESLNQGKTSFEKIAKKYPSHSWQSWRGRCQILRARDAEDGGEEEAEGEEEIIEDLGDATVEDQQAAHSEIDTEDEEMPVDMIDAPIPSLAEVALATQATSKAQAVRKPQAPITSPELLQRNGNRAIHLRDRKADEMASPVSQIEDDFDSEERDDFIDRAESEKPIPSKRRKADPETPVHRGNQLTPLPESGRMVHHHRGEKVASAINPETPKHAIETRVPTPPSGRAVHHERGKIVPTAINPGSPTSTPEQNMANPKITKTEAQTQSRIRKEGTPSSAIEEHTPPPPKSVKAEHHAAHQSSRKTAGPPPKWSQVRPLPLETFDVHDPVVNMPRTKAEEEKADFEYMSEDDKLVALEILRSQKKRIEVVHHVGNSHEHEQARIPDNQVDKNGLTVSVADSLAKTGDQVAETTIEHHDKSLVVTLHSQTLLHQTRTRKRTGPTEVPGTPGSSPVKNGLERSTALDQVPLPSPLYSLEGSPSPSSPIKVPSVLDSAAPELELELHADAPLPVHATPSQDPQDPQERGVDHGQVPGVDHGPLTEQQRKSRIQDALDDAISTQALRDPNTTLSNLTSLIFPSDEETETDESERERRRTSLAAAKLRKLKWIHRQVKEYDLPSEDAEYAWFATGGVQSLAMKVVKALAQGDRTFPLFYYW